MVGRDRRGWDTKHEGPGWDAASSRERGWPALTANGSQREK